MKVNTPCEFQWCRKNHLVDLMIERGNSKVLVAIIRKYQNDLCEMEEDLGFHRAVLDGSWPSATDYALAILESAAGHEDRDQVNIGRIMQYLSGALKRNPELKFAQKRSNGSYFWTLVNTGAATQGDVLVAEFGEKDRLLNYVNLGPVAANTEVTFPATAFRYCITLRAEYSTRSGPKTLMCAFYRNTVFNGRARPLTGVLPMKAYPGITRKAITHA